MNNSILIAEHIQKSYDKNVVLQDVSLHMKQGDIYGLIGKNGAGKTTLLRILTGLIQEYTGTVTTGENEEKPCKVAAVINAPALFLNMSAAANMKEQARLQDLRGTEKIEQVLHTVGLENCKNKLAKNFSLGMTQRLKLGLALLESPNILILDEPVNGLDPDGIADLRELFIRLNKENGMSILISSHILSELEHTATCFGILHEGKIVKEISIQNVLQSGSTLEEIYMQYTRGVKQ